MDPASQKLPGWLFPASLSHFMLPFRDELAPSTAVEFACPECYPADARSINDGFGGSQDACGELLVLQHRIIVHGGPKNWRAQYKALSLEVSKRASAIFASIGPPKTSVYSEIVGVYHPAFISTDSPQDCLERVELHFYMDGVVDHRDRNNCSDEPFEFEGDLSAQKDRQDILGRTALLIACREQWKDAVVRLLEEEADPGLATIYGSLPLHYAALNGSIDICKQLLERKTKFDLEAKDCLGKTALDWARKKNHQDVVNLLSIEYAVARVRRELGQVRSLGAET